MAAIDYKNARVFASLQRVVKDIDNNLRLVDIVDTDTIAASYVNNDVVLCAETGTCIGVSMVALSFYKHNGTTWSLLAYTTQETMSKRTQKFGTDGNVVSPIEIPDPTNPNHPIKKVAFDGLAEDLLAEASARANADWELEQGVDDTKTRLQDEYAPTYAPPYIISLNLSENILEVGEVAELSIDSIDVDSRQGGAADDSEGSMKAYIDNDLQEFDPDYSEGSFGPYVLGNVSKNTPGNIAIKLELPYAQGPLLQDTLYNEDYPTGRIPDGTMTRTENLPVSNYAWYGAAESLPAENQIRTVGLGSASNTITIVIGATDTCAFLFVPAGRSIQSIIDTTNLNAPMTYIKQALTTMPAGGAVTYTGEYWALFFSPYGKIVNHVATLVNS